MGDTETVTISKREYELLLASDRKLDILMAYGVDNTDVYDMAMSELYADDTFAVAAYGTVTKGGSQ